MPQRTFVFSGPVPSRPEEFDPLIRRVREVFHSQTFAHVAQAEQLPIYRTSALLLRAGPSLDETAFFPL